MSLSDGLTRAAEMHRNYTLAMIRGSRESVTVFVPGDRPESGGASMFGDLATASTAPVEKGPFKCLWMNAASFMRTDPSKTIQLAGKYQDATAFITVALEDVLITPSSPYSETWFDKATYVVHRGQRYEVLGTERDGMANIEPYVLVVMLAGEVRRRA